MQGNPTPSLAGFDSCLLLLKFLVHGVAKKLYLLILIRLGLLAVKIKIYISFNTV